MVRGSMLEGGLYCLEEEKKGKEGRKGGKVSSLEKVVSSFLRDWDSQIFRHLDHSGSRSRFSSRSHLIFIIVV